MVCFQMVDERDNDSYKGNNPTGLCSIRNIMSPPPFSRGVLVTPLITTLLVYISCLLLRGQMLK